MGAFELWRESNFSAKHSVQLTRNKPVTLNVADGEYLFVDPENKLSKYAPKNWRNSHTYVSSSRLFPAAVPIYRDKSYRRLDERENDRTNEETRIFSLTTAAERVEQKYLKRAISQNHSGWEPVWLMTARATITDKYSADRAGLPRYALISDEHRPRGFPASACAPEVAIESSPPFLACLLPLDRCSIITDLSQTIVQLCRLANFLTLFDGRQQMEEDTIIFRTDFFVAPK